MYKVSLEVKIFPAITPQIRAAAYLQPELSVFPGKPDIFVLVFRGLGPRRVFRRGGREEYFHRS